MHAHAQSRASLLPPSLDDGHAPGGTAALRSPRSRGCQARGPGRSHHRNLGREQGAAHRGQDLRCERLCQAPPRRQRHQISTGHRRVRRVSSHSRSAKAAKTLATLPSRSAASALQGGEEEQDPLALDFEALRCALEAEGYFEPNLPHVAYRLVELGALHWAGFSLIWSGWWWLGALLAGIAQGRCGWLMHEGGHYSLTGNIALDRHLQMASYGVGCGMSACYWRNQHNKHHCAPQKLGADPDLQTLPLVAFHRLIGQSGSKVWLALQAPLFFSGVITTLVGFAWQFVLHPRHAWRVGNYVEVGWLALRYVLWHLCFGHMGLGGSLRLYTAYLTIGATYIFLNFAVSHTHKDVVPRAKHLSWVHYAASHTTNCTPSWWCNWWMSYLNFQIEHHLFPSMPQCNHPKIAPRVQALLAKHGLDYDCRSYWECLRVTWQNLWAVGHDDHRQRRE